MNHKVNVILNKLKTKGTIQHIIGWPIAFFFVVGGGSVVIEDGIEHFDLFGTLLALFGSLLGFLIIHWARKNKGVSAIFVKYHTFLHNHRVAMEINYEEIAHIMGEPVDKVTSEVTLLIKHQLWVHVHGGEDAVLDREEKRRASEALKNKHEANSTKTVTCDSCLGTTTVNAYSTSPKCQYCGSSLREELRSK